MFALTTTKLLGFALIRPEVLQPFFVLRFKS